MKVEAAKEKLRQAAREPVLLTSARAAMHRYPKTGLLAAFAVGLAIGASSRARQSVGHLLSAFLKNAVLPDISADD